jgi:hypothetical protein
MVPSAGDGRPVSALRPSPWTQLERRLETNTLRRLGGVTSLLARGRTVPAGSTSKCSSIWSLGIKPAFTSEVLPAPGGEWRTTTRLAMTWEMSSHSSGSRPKKAPLSARSNGREPMKGFPSRWLLMACRVELHVKSIGSRAPRLEGTG